MRAAAVVLFTLLASACERPCASDAECPAPAVCGPTRTCAVPPPAEDGAPCRHDANCKGGACLFSPAGNTCATSCADVSACPSERCAPALDARPEGSALRFVCRPADGTRFLAERCSTDTECRSGLCEREHCTSPCGTCPTPLACTPALVTREGSALDVGTCTWWPVMPTVELGGVDTPAMGPAVVSFEVPAGAGAFTVLVEDFAERVPTITRLVAPGGVVFVGTPGDGGSRDLARPSNGRGRATVLVPGSDDPRAVPPAGTWRLELATLDPMAFPVMQRQVAGRVDRVAVFFKEPSPGGRLDLTVHVSPATRYAPDGSFISTMLDSLDGLLRNKVGASLGEVQVLALPADGGTAVMTSARADALWAEHSRGTEGARPVNLLVVEELSFAGGVSGGEPGPPGLYRRNGTGVLIEPLASGPQTTAVLASHELFHFLGLQHTSDEFRGPDLVSDTPSCATPARPGCADERNIMFPFFPTREPLTITAGQRKVLEGSPWLTHHEHPRACLGAGAYALTGQRFLSSSLVGARAGVTATCGGSGAQRAHLLRLETGATRLEARVTGTGFSPVLSVRRGDCGAAEVACAIADGGVASVRVDNPGADAWFLLVDTLGDAGVYSLSVDVTR